MCVKTTLFVASSTSRMFTEMLLSFPSLLLVCHLVPSSILTLTSSICSSLPCPPPQKKIHPLFRGLSDRAFVNGCYLELFDSGLGKEHRRLRRWANLTKGRSWLVPSDDKKLLVWSNFRIILSFFLSRITSLSPHTISWGLNQQYLKRQDIGFVCYTLHVIVIACLWIDYFITTTGI